MLPDHFQQRLEELRNRARFRKLVPRSGGLVFEVGGRRIVNFGSNDYLGLANERLDRSAQPHGSGASALVCGWTDQHAELARSIASLEQTEAAVVFPSGYAACSGVVAAIASQGDLILSDELNHASIIDGCRLSKAQVKVFPHRDYRWVNEFLLTDRSRHREVWIVTDGVFSMDGHVAPLADLCDVAERHQARMVVDEAHATGVLGDGRGTCHALGVADRVAVRMGTLSKAVGAQGGFACGSESLIDYLVNFSRPLIFSTSLAPTAVASAMDGLQSIRQQPERRQRVVHRSRWFRNELSINADELESQVPIISIEIGEDAAAVDASEQLWEAGFYVPAIRPPTVPEGTARLRVSLSASHHDEDIEHLVTELLPRISERSAG